MCGPGAVSLNEKMRAQTHVRRWVLLGVVGPLAGVLCLGLLVLLALRKDFAHRGRFEKLTIGMPVSDVEAVFRRPPDCTVQVGEFEGRYYNSDHFGGSLCGQGRLKVGGWSEFPRGPYCSALVIVGPARTVDALQLCGESWLEKAPRTGIPIEVSDLC